MLLFQIWSLRDKFWVKWSLFHKQQNSSVFPEGCDYNFIEILDIWMLKLASVFIRIFSFQCKNEEVKNTFLFYRFGKTSTYLGSNSFKHFVAISLFYRTMQKTFEKINCRGFLLTKWTLVQDISTLFSHFENMPNEHNIVIRNSVVIYCMNLFNSERVQVPV